MKNTIDQIQDLISKLDDKSSMCSVENNSSIYETLCQSRNEINLTLPNDIKLHFKMDEALASANVNHIPFELRSILANLVNNSVEAIAGSGKIIINLADKIDSIEIIVSDNGEGIDPEVLPKVFDRNFSYNKQNGSGVGLSHAKDFVEKWNGSIHVTSSYGFGTSVQIKLPVQSRKSWYLPRLKINTESDIFVLDDQQLNLDLWKFRFNESGIKNNIFYLKNKDELNLKIQNYNFELQNAIFLFDYDLGETTKGLDLLKSIPSASVKCLVTGHFDDAEIQSKCDDSGVYLLSKGQIADVHLAVLN